MKLTRIRFSQDASAKLSQLKGRTGLTPNLLCRIAFCLSIEEPYSPNPDDFSPNSDREIERQVLLGPWDQLFVALIKERCSDDQLDITDEELLGIQFRAHVHRGVNLLHKRVKTLTDLSHLMPKTGMLNYKDE